MFIGTWALIRPMRNIFSPVSGWNALSYKYLHLHNSSSVIFKSSRLSPFLCNNCLVNVRTENSIKWVGNYLYFVTTSRACSSCPPVANRFKGFVTARKWSALPLYVLWSQYGFSMSILSFDILPTPATPRSFPHTCSFVPSAARTHTRPRNPTTPGSSPAAVSFARLDSKSTWARFHTGWSSREDAQASPATESNRCTTRYRPSLLDLSIPILLSLSLSIYPASLTPFDAVIDNACTPARPPPTTTLSLPPPPRDGDTLSVWNLEFFVRSSGFERYKKHGWKVFSF